MKIRIEIDCEPEEARRFLGMPDVGEVQEAFLAEVRERLQKGLGEWDAESLMQAWMPAGLQGMEELQKAFFAGLGKGGTAQGKKKK